MDESNSQEQDETQKELALEEILKEHIALSVSAASNFPLIGQGYELLNVNQKYATINKNFRTRIFNLIQILLKNAGYTLSPNTNLDNINELSPAFEFLLDRAVINLDAFEHDTEGETKIHAPDGAVKKATDSIPNEIDGRYASLLTKSVAPISSAKQVITKPQAQFQDSIVNDDSTFVPKLRFKHHDSKQNAKSGLTLSGGNQRREWLSDLDSTQEHPYQYEILHFKVPEKQLEMPNPDASFKPLSETQLTLIETEEGLKKLIETLNNSTEFAVDLEHHSHRSFLGLTCLLQISTRDKDYVIDPFPIWNSMHLLNEPFTNPKILKVFHGADSDIVWLQRDFGIYVVNMLDTAIIMKLLEQPKRSLQALVYTYCNILLEKAYQKDDWRVRPLDYEHLKYARSDTHYLLYCCDKLIESVKKQNKFDLMDVYNQSKELCLKQFIQPRFNPNDFVILVERSGRSFDNRQMIALQELWKWRDKTARQEDESLQFVLPDHMMFHISDILPREVQGIMSCCSPTPSLVKRDIFLIHRLIKNARDLPIEEKKNLFDTEKGESLLLEAVRNHQQKLNKYTRDYSRLDCRFDQTEIKVDDIRPPAETRYRQLFQEELKMVKSSNQEIEPILPFKSISRQNKTKKHLIAEKIWAKMTNWATPYDSYLVEVTSNQDEEPAEKRRKLVHSTIKQEEES